MRFGCGDFILSNGYRPCLFLLNVICEFNYTSSEVAKLQDLLIYVCKGISDIIVKGKLDISELEDVNHEVIKSMFITITNANFDAEAIEKQIHIMISFRNKLKQNVSVTKLHDSAQFSITDRESMLEKAAEIGVLQTADQLVALTLKTRQFGVAAMALEANTSKYGNPELTTVDIGVRNNPAILISGHDLTDLEQLLEQTRGTGVDVYTHSEMLPAHYYPFFKKYDNFAGNYGGSWWRQVDEFGPFGGPILFTTNCIIPPRSEEIRDRIFTTGAAGYPGSNHIEADADGNKDFSPIIEMAKKLPSPTEI